MHIITATAVSVHQTELFALEALPRMFSLTMANYSIPDNGTSFFSYKYGLKHTTSTPHYPL